jgi:3-methylcrotonyl-CoA carboxylase alpha subunit
MGSGIASLLIANRGEIACRIARTCRRLGIRSIAVYSDADAGALHSRVADAAVHIGGAEPRDSYLNVERIVAAAREHGADGIHPGYGFLSERAELAEACTNAGLVWVGPTPRAMRLAGDKAACRRLAASISVPTVPGYDGEDQSDGRFVDEANRCGYPVLIKAAAGGGGRGMRLITESAQLVGSLASARREAFAAFGDDRLLLERYIHAARHIEVQVAADQHGTVIDLGERDCSLQRRHQKVIEESPAPSLSAETRGRLGTHAVALARAVGYTNLGTFEFIVDERGEPYFIEVNARLQVEHPVTELVTGLDLVELQLGIASGSPLGLTREDVPHDGHAIEARLCAEDAHAAFLPSAGRLDRLELPMVDGVRIDAGYEAGDNVSPHYDNLIAKLIAHAPTRDAAIRMLLTAIRELSVAGVVTNAPFLVWALRQRPFAEGRASTQTIGNDWLPSEHVAPPAAFLAAAAALDAQRDVRDSTLAWRPSGVGIPHVFEAGSGRRLAFTSFTSMYPSVQVGGELMVSSRASGDWVELGDEPLHVASLGRDRIVSRGTEYARLIVAGPPLLEDAGADGHAGRGDVVTSPLPGVVGRLLVAVGDTVRTGQIVAIVHAMKIEHAIAASRAGVVARVHCQEGAIVAAGTALLEVGDLQHPTPS